MRAWLARLFERLNREPRWAGIWDGVTLPGDED